MKHTADSNCDGGGDGFGCNCRADRDHICGCDGVSNDRVGSRYRTGLKRTPCSASFCLKQKDLRMQAELTGWKVTVPPVIP